MDRKEFIVAVDSLSDRELRQLFNFIYEEFVDEGKEDLLAEQIEGIKSQRNI